MGKHDSPAPVPLTHSIGVIVGVPNAKVNLVNVNPSTYGKEQNTLDAGTTVFTGIPNGTTLIELLVQAKGYKTFNQRIPVPNGNTNIVFVGPYSSNDVYIGPLQIALQDLVANGPVLTLADGTPFTVKECSDFNLLARFKAEGAEAIRPVLAQRSSIGFNILRVWTAMENIPNVGNLVPCPYDIIPAFVSLCAEYNLHVEFTAYTGWNDPSHWNNLINAALLCTPYPLLELVNEVSANTDEPDSMGRVFNLDLHEQAPAPLLSCHGSNGADKPVGIRPPWSYEVIHVNGQSEWWRKSSHNAMELTYGGDDLPASHKPAWTGEQTRYDDNESSLEHVYDAAAASTLLCAGAGCYHSILGKTSQLFEGRQLDAAIQFCSGSDSVPLKFQLGRYSRPDPGIYLRVYTKTISSGEVFTVNIRF